MSLSLSERQFYWISFYALIVTSWIGLLLMHGVNLATPPSLSLAYLQALCVSAGESSPLLLFFMWCLMAIAMMLPTFLPAVKVFEELSSCGASDKRTIFALVLGYLVIWLGFAGLGTMSQIWLSNLGLITPEGASLSFLFTAILLFMAGFYQFSPLKEACISQCRNPLTFFMERWKPGFKPAFNMGIQLGLACLGCCWALMTLGFVGGTMNIIWMGLATLFMSFEKLSLTGRYLTPTAGAICLGLGMFFLLRSAGF